MEDSKTNHSEFPNVSVINTRCINYLLTKLRNKETDRKVRIAKSMLFLEVTL